MSTATDQWRYGLRWAEQTISRMATTSVLEGWRWWRPSYSAGYHAGLAAAADVVLAARLDAEDAE